MDLRPALAVPVFFEPDAALPLPEPERPFGLREPFPPFPFLDIINA